MYEGKPCNIDHVKEGKPAKAGDNHGGSMKEAMLCDCNDPDCKGKLRSLRQCPNCKNDTQYWLLLGSLFGVCPECEPIVIEKMKKCFYKMGQDIAQRREQRILDIISGKK